jgi:peptidyl-prolyl isomerase H (cyclophilin H)
MADPNVTAAIARGNAVVFFDITLATIPLGRVRFELFTTICPKTCENFRQFCTGEFTKNQQPVGYKGCGFHRIIKGFMIQGGDIVKGDGTGKTSIYNEIAFDDENFDVKHTGPGCLAMANSGPNTNGCQFYVTCGPADWLDNKHVVFGKVLDQESMLTIRKMENVQTAGENRPKMKVEISECGEL